jgi:hypothetical protein
MKNCIRKEVASHEEYNKVVFYYLSSSDLISGVAFGGSDLIKEGL